MFSTIRPLIAFFGILAVAAASGSNFVKPEERIKSMGCIPNGAEVQYECSVTDPDGHGSTTWDGSLFQCPSRNSIIHNQIHLPHVLFTNDLILDMCTDTRGVCDGIFGVCDGIFGVCDGIFGCATGVNSSVYSSLLNMIVTSDMNGKSLLCSSHTTLHLGLIGEDVLKVESEPLPPELLRVTGINQTQALLTWSPVPDVDYELRVNSANCGCEDGQIVDGNTTSLICSPVSPSGQCVFEISSVSQDCGVSSVAAKTAGLVLLDQSLRCIPEGTSIQYECSINDVSTEGATLWSGSVLQCSEKGDQINLPHQQFSDRNNESCGEASVFVTSVNGYVYSSRLSMTATKSMSGSNVSCSLGTSIIIGSDVLTVGSQPPPPEQFIVNDTNQSAVFLSWSPVLDIESYWLQVSDPGCGCKSGRVDRNTTDITCRSVDYTEQCQFEIQSISSDCGFFSTARLPIKTSTDGATEDATWLYYLIPATITITITVIAVPAIILYCYFKRV